MIAGCRHWLRSLGTRIAAAVATTLVAATAAVVVLAFFSNTPATESNSFTAAAVHHITTTPSSSSITAGTSQAYTVTAFSPTNASYGDVTASTTFSITPDGSCSGSSCTATIAGVHTVTATFWGVSTTASLTVTASTATKLVFTQQPSGSTGGTAFATQPVVTVEDQYGNTASGDSSSVTLSIKAGTGTGGATLTCTTNPLSASAGVASFAGCKIDKTGAGYQLHAADGSLAAADSSALTISNGPLAAFAVSSPGTQTAGTSFAVTVTAQDAGGNAATGWTSVTGCVTLSGPSNSPNATAPAYPAAGACGSGNSSLGFNASAQASATLTLYDAQTTALTVTSVSSPAGKTGTSASFTVVNQNTLSAFTVSPSTATPTAGTAFTVSLTALDPYGNADTGYTGSQCVTFSGPASSPGGTAPSYPAKGSCTSGSALTFAAGIATGANAASITLYDAQAVTLTAADNPSSKSGTAGLSVGAAALSAFTMPTPAGQTAGVSFNVTVTAKDAYGNAASGWVSTTLCVGFSGPSNSPGGTAPAYPAAGACSAGNSSLAFNASAQATASLTLYDSQTTALTATSVSAPAGKTGSTGSFTVAAGSAAKLAFTAQPGGGAVNAAWTAQPVVTVEDTWGNTITGSAASVTLAIGTNPAAGTLTCTANPNAAVAGVATFAGCTINLAATGYTLTASSAGLTSTTSSAFNVTMTITPAALTGGQTGTAYSQTLSATGGTGAVTWAVTSGSLPAGITLSGSTLSGSPTTVGAYAFTVAATDSLSPTHNTSSQAYTIYIYSATLVASGNATSGSSVTTSSSVTFTSSTTYLVLGYTHANGANGTLSVSSTAAGLSFTQIGAQQNYDSGVGNYTAWYATGNGASGTVTVSTTSTISNGYLAVVKLQGNSTSSPVVSATEGFANAGAGSGTSATANLAAAPTTGDYEFIFQNNVGGSSSTSPTSSVNTITLLSGSFLHSGNNNKGATISVFSGAAQQNDTLTLGSSVTWGTMAIEIAHP